jgi:hypothetical protein
MSKKHFSALLAVTVIVAIVVLLIPGKTGKENLFETDALLPDLAGQVNDVRRVEIVTRGAETVATLERGESGWGVAEADGYPADWERLRTLLRDLAQAEAIEAKTDKPEYYARLGVEDVSDPDASGVMVVISADQTLASVIIGKSAQGRQGQYVRLGDQAASALIGTSLRVPADLPSWLEKQIIDIPASDVVSWKVTHADGEVVEGIKASPDAADFDLQNIPDGREVSSTWSVNQVGGALAALQLEGVRKDDGDEWAERWAGATRFSLVQADGLRIDADLVAIDDERWIRLAASVEAASGSTGAADASTDAEPAATEDAEAQDQSEGEAEPSQQAPEARAAGINDRVGGWAYRVATYKYDAMAKRMEDMLKEVDES